MKIISKFCALLLTCRIFNSNSFVQTCCNLVYFINSLKHVYARIPFKLYSNNVRIGKLPDTIHLTCYLQQITSTSHRIPLKKIVQT